MRKLMLILLVIIFAFTFCACSSHRIDFVVEESSIEINDNVNLSGDEFYSNYASAYFVDNNKPDDGVNNAKRLIRLSVSCGVNATVNVEYINVKGQNMIINVRIYDYPIKDKLSNNKILYISVNAEDVMRVTNIIVKCIK